MEKFVLCISKWSQTNIQSNRSILEREQNNCFFFTSEIPVALTFELARFYHRHLFYVRIIFIEWMNRRYWQNTKTIFTFGLIDFFRNEHRMLYLPAHFSCIYRFEVHWPIQTYSERRNKQHFFSNMIFVCSVYTTMYSSKSFSFTYLFARQKHLKIECYAPVLRIENQR